MNAPYYEVKIHGEYFAQVGDKRELRGYSATFKLPNAENALGIIKGKLLTPFLMKKDNQTVGVYTHFVDEILCYGKRLEPNDIPVRFQSKDQLREYVKYHQLGINVDEYGSVGLLRDHVRMAKEEPMNFPKVQEKYKAKQSEEKALFDLNADVLDNMVTHQPVLPKEIPGGDVEPEAKPAPKAKKARKSVSKPAAEAPEPAQDAEPEDESGLLG
jgi:hypothetical protein